MPQSNNQNNSGREMVDDLAASLRSTTLLIQNLIGEIRDNATSLAVLKEKLESLSENVEHLSHIVRDGNGRGSMVTRLTLAERVIEDLEEGMDEMKELLEKSITEIKRDIKAADTFANEAEEKEKQHKRELMIGKLKLAAVVLPGLIALGLAIFSAIK